MSLIKKIKTAVEALGFQFIYDSGAGIDKTVSELDICDCETIVFAFLLSTTTLTDGKESGQVGLFFARKTEYDFGALENDDIQEQTKIDAHKFIKSVDKGNVLTVGEISLKRFYDELSVNLTGVAINTLFSERVGLSDCLTF